MKKLIQVVGPSFTNYSLARVNRGLALALSEIQNEYEVAVVSNNIYAERDPSPEDLNEFPGIKKLIKTEIDPEGIVIYNNFPRDPNSKHQIEEINAKIKLVYMAWEESIYPEKWIDSLNKFAHGVICSSSFVEEILRKCGLQVPSFIGLNAVDSKIIGVDADTDYKLHTTKNYKLLHISSGYPRKGTDVLINAFNEEFSDKDNIALVIKSLPHGLNQTPKWIEDAKNRKDDHPEIELINADISDEELNRLIETCDASVYPTRAEGFGLPIAESMLKKKPVISTGYGAHLDFTSEQNSFLIDYKLVDATSSQLTNLGAKWAEPDVEHLKKLLRNLYENHDSDEIDEKVQLAYSSAKELTWENTAKKFVEIIKTTETTYALKSCKRVVITERNNQSGIAEYSRYLHTNIDHAFEETIYYANSDVPDLVSSDSKNIKRNWVTGEINFDQVLSEIDNDNPEFVHFEYHSGKFKPEALGELIKNLLEKDKKVILTLHSANKHAGSINRNIDYLKNLHKIIVHTELEYSNLIQKGLKNVELVVMGNITPLRINESNLKEVLGLSDYYPIIATHGLLNERKGIGQIIKSMEHFKKEFKNPLFISINAVSVNNISSQNTSNEYQNLAKDMRIEENVLFIDDFLDYTELLALLQLCDVNLLAYDDIPEGASLAVQMLIAANKPMLLTDIPMFNAVKDLGLTIRDNKPESIFNGVLNLIQDKEEQKRQSMARKEYLNKNNWNQKSIEVLTKYS